MLGMSGGDRWPRRVYGVGKDPDPRFTFANERTFLAWIRTALAMLAAGVALHAFVEDVNRALRTAAAITLIAAGIIFGLLAYARWMAGERAMRLGRPLPSSLLLPLVAYTIAGVGLLSVVLVLVGCARS